MEEQQLPQQSINVINSDEHIQQLEEIFKQYFVTLEEQQKIKEKELKEQALQEEEDTLVQEDFQTQLLQEIKTLQEYQQYSNNLLYTGIILAGTVFISVLIYKFLKIFL